jgi:hypothetical protein
MSEAETKTEEKEIPQISNKEFWVKLWQLLNESHRLIFVILAYT